MQDDHPAYAVIRARYFNEFLSLKFDQCLVFIDGGLPFEQGNRRAGHDGRNRMLVDKLGVTIPAQENTEIVKPGDNALQLDAIDQEDCEWNFLFSDVVQEGVLQVLHKLFCRGLTPSFLVDRLALFLSMFVA